MKVSKVQYATLQHLFEGSEEWLSITHMAGCIGLDKCLGHVRVHRLLPSESCPEKTEHGNTDYILIIPPDFFSGDPSFCTAGRYYHAASPFNVACYAFPGATHLPDEAVYLAETFGIPAFSSGHDEYLLESRLIGLCREKIDLTVTVHGTLIAMHGIGVLIIGDSGTGKTACALRMVQGGHACWVADDAVVMEKRGPHIYGRGHEKISHLLEVRGKGVVDISTLLGEGELLHETRVAAVISIETETSSPKEMSNQTRYEILGVSFPLIKLSLPNCVNMEDNYIIDSIKKEVFS